MIAVRSVRPLVSLLISVASLCTEPINTITGAEPIMDWFQNPPPPSPSPAQTRTPNPPTAHSEESFNASSGKDPMRRTVTVASELQKCRDELETRLYTKDQEILKGREVEHGLKENFEGGKTSGDRGPSPKVLGCLVNSSGAMVSWRSAWMDRRGGEMGRSSQGYGGLEAERRMRRCSLLTESAPSGHPKGSPRC
ncbi:hypothetical protein JZ751_021128 [Albula glossodonta]|uniref:Uncharacterized protein n=1 Tax=Albula glossodonta TaxID=121402 RepID=A0A8T2PJH6_9TELE|nr:hypothetical protein JZ751_021128 [Albula glossodonta]